MEWLKLAALAAAEYPTGATLPDLTATSPDAALVAWLMRQPSYFDTVKIQAEQAYRAAGSRRYAAKFDLDDYWEKAVWEVRSHHRHIPFPGNRTVEEHTMKLAQMRVYLRARDHFVAYVEGYERQTDTERQSAYEASRWHAINAQRAKEAGVSVQPAPPPFSPQGFLSELARRGIAVAPLPNGQAQVHPAGLLTVQDRMQLTAHKAAIISALGSAEVF